MSSIPGAAVPTTSMTPVRFSRLATRANPWSRRYSSSASGAEIASTSTSGRSSASAGFPSSSTTSTRRPASAAARAITAVTVVFPTPPLPATTTTRAAVNDCSGNSLSGGTCAQTSDRHAHAGGRAHTVRLRASRPRTTPTPTQTLRPPWAAIDVLQVSGFMDPILVDAIDDAIDRAVDDGSQALILQVNSDGTVVGDDVVEDLLVRVATAPIPIGIWVGPSGARFYGTAAQLLAVADVTGMAPGRAGRLHRRTARPARDARGCLGRLRRRRGTSAQRVGRAVRRPHARACSSSASTTRASRRSPTWSRRWTATRRTASCWSPPNSPCSTTVRPASTPCRSCASRSWRCVDQLFHTVASPPVAYLLLLIGLALLIFEFFTAGVGIAGVVGAVCTVLACTGLAVLPTRTWAVALIMLAMIAFAIDVQVGIPRFWTGVGIVFTVIGSWFLFESIPGSSMRRRGSR